ncbi:acylneuraminate cytidylyltransferase family protein [Pectobacterium cacticida]|uniref:acylneuraminate cytidylyltransferase family protein n=1 Tax=Pectobacterium cacticida TaxID=69221 RepID=UPI002FEEA98F
MKVVAFVPLKLNNERLPGKNTKMLKNGRPLVDYILNTLGKVNEIDESYVYCSSESIVDYINDSNIKYLKRPESLDSSSTKINEVLLSFANDVEADIYVLVHATAPFISAESISKAISSIVDGGHDSALAVSAMREFLWSGGKPMNYDLENIPRTQDLTPVYVETTGLYVYTRDLILTKNRRIGSNPFLVEVSKIEALDVNEPIDFNIVDAVSDYMSF